MLRLIRHVHAEPHTSTPRRHDLSVQRTDRSFLDVARYRNETHVHPRTPSVKSSVGKAQQTRASAASEWSPAEAERTVKSARPAFGGCNASYTVVEPRLFGARRP
jgi:hypothetical protein